LAQVVLPVGLQHHQPHAPRHRLDPLSFPLRPGTLSVRAPLPAETLPIGGQLEPPLPGNDRFLVAESESFPLDLAVNRRGTAGAIHALHAPAHLGQSHSPVAGVPQAGETLPRRQDARARPLAPAFAARGTPLAAELFAVGGQLEPALALGVGLLVRKRQSVLLHRPADRTAVALHVVVSLDLLAL